MDSSMAYSKLEEKESKMGFIVFWCDNFRSMRGLPSIVLESSKWSSRDEEIFVCISSEGARATF